MEQLAPHAKIYVDPAFLDDENHGSLGCAACHGGDPEAPDALAAHAGLMRDPTWPDPERVCGDCHPDLVEASRTSLHTTLSPFKTATDLRAGSGPGHADVDAGRRTHCGACHASCGQCHVSRPTYVGGGLLDAHAFTKKPPMREVCTACHGSRIQREYFGGNEGVPADVHWRKRFMDCAECHDGQEMHGGGPAPADRREAPHAPRCLDCHQAIYADKAENLGQHMTHRDKVACQVCHAVAYKNCYGCHFALDRFGFRYFRNAEDAMDFRIGLNPLRSERRPEQFVTLRHVPVAPDTFGFYAPGGLPRFDAAPTWKLATPHTIRRATPQNAGCAACHGKGALFLKPDDLRPGYRAANLGVAVPAGLMPKALNGQPAVENTRREAP